MSNQPVMSAVMWAARKEVELIVHSDLIRDEKLWELVTEKTFDERMKNGFYSSADA